MKPKKPWEHFENSSMALFGKWIRSKWTPRNKVRIIGKNKENTIENNKIYKLFEKQEKFKLSFANYFYCIYRKIFNLL